MPFPSMGGVSDPVVHEVISMDQRISRNGATYFVDTLTAPVTLTVDDTLTFFTIHDCGLNFALHNCIVDFGGGLTRVLDAKGEMAVFFKDSDDVWFIRGFGAGIGTRVGGYVLPIVNGDANQGFTGWVPIVGQWENLHWQGRNYFAARFSNIADLQQDVPIPSPAVPQLGRGSGLATLVITWEQLALFGVDQGNVILEFFDANMVSLGTNPGPGLSATTQSVWEERTTGDVALPTNTHTVRITLQARHAPGHGFANYAHFDNVAGTVNV